MGKWTVKTFPKYRNRKWYTLHWTGKPLGYLSDGRTMGSYKYPADAYKRAAELNAANSR